MKLFSVVGVRVCHASFITAKYCHYLTQLMKEKVSSARKLVVVKIAFQFLFSIHMLAKRCQNIHFITSVFIKVKLRLLCGNILSTCQYFKPKFFLGLYRCIAFLNLCV